jgi:hypothetical protein
MKFLQDSWRVLGAPLLVLTAVLLVGGGAVYWTAKQASRAHQAFEQERAARDQVRNRLAQADEEKRLILHYAPAYENLLAQGIIGAEHRVNWLDAVRMASQSVHGFGVDYQLSRQAGALFAIDAGRYELQQSTMKLRLRLLHEGDLLAFLNSLDRQQAGLSLLQECSIEQLARGGFVVRFEPKLAASCELTWITLNDQAIRGAR